MSQLIYAEEAESVDVGQACWDSSSTHKVPLFCGRGW